jgi:hypothetical protein
MYVGSPLDGKFDESLPAEAYESGTGNENDGVTVFQDPKGDVYWLAHMWNSTGIYKIHGFDGWKRSTGKLSIARAMPTAGWKGTGLSGEYFANQDPSGKPAKTRLDPLL